MRLNLFKTVSQHILVHDGSVNLYLSKYLSNVQILFPRDCVTKFFYFRLQVFIGLFGLVELIHFLDCLADKDISIH